MDLQDTARVPLVTDREQVEADHRDYYDHIAATRGSVRGPFSALFNSPEVAGRVGELGAYVRYEGVLDDDVRELAILTTARQCGCLYEWAVHEPIAREAGVSDAAVEALVAEGDVDDLSETAALVVTYGRELLGECTVSGATFESARDEFGVQGVTELTATMGYYAMLALFCNAFSLVPADHDVPFPPAGSA